MKIRRKIWSLPVVLVTALLLVGLFGAAVLAQTPDLTPNEDVAIDEQSITVGSSGSAIAAPIELADKFIHKDDPVPPAQPDPVARVYTALTTDNEVAEVVHYAC